MKNFVKKKLFHFSTKEQKPGNHKQNITEKHRFNYDKQRINSSGFKIVILKISLLRKTLLLPCYEFCSQKNAVNYCNYEAYKIHFIGPVSRL